MTRVAAENAIRAWLVAATGAEVIFEPDSGARPAVPFLTVALGGDQPVGAADAVTTTYDPTAGEGEEIIVAAVGARRVQLRIQAFTALANGNDCAVDLLNRAISRLGLPTVRQALVAAGIGIADRGQVTPIPKILSTDWEGRAVVDVTLNTVARAEETTTYIERVGYSGVFVP